MHFEWTKTLTEEQRKSAEIFYNSFEFVNIESYPGWNNIELTKTDVSYCIASEKDVIKAFVTITEYPPVEIRMIYGPLCKTVADTLLLIDEVIRYYKKKNILSLKILLGMESGNQSQELQYLLYKKHPFKIFFDKHNKGSLRLRLDNKTEEEILKTFSTHHKRAIEKGRRGGLHCKVLETSEEAELFADGYKKMLLGRKISLSNLDSAKSFTSVHQWVKENKKGFLLGIFSNEKMIGGLLIIYRGIYAEYYKGFSLPQELDIPINHFGFYEAMKLAKKDGIVFFDFGGYNILVTDHDQIVQINRFKKGFNGEVFFYPMTMYFGLKPMGTAIASGLIKLSRILKGK